MSAPYYQDRLVTLYHGDAREILPTLPSGSFDAVITDPVWPNATNKIAGHEDPFTLFGLAAIHFPRLAKRAAIQLGCNSDPRFLLAMPSEWPFLRTCHLEYAVPSHQGRLLMTGDIAYCFGEWPPSREGARVLPGRCLENSTGRIRRNGHPCSRRLAHAAWLVGWWSVPGGNVLDPFAGGGTTLVAAKNAGRPSVGIEIEERFCEIAAKACAQETLDLEERK